MPASGSGVPLEVLAVRVVLRLQREPDTWTIRSLARDLGESANRVGRIVLAIEQEGRLERSGAYGRLRVTPSPPTGPAAPAS